MGEISPTLSGLLMKARREKGMATRQGDLPARERARAAADEAKHELGERGEPWWSDGSQDLNRHLVKNTVYANWFGRIGDA